MTRLTHIQDLSFQLLQVILIWTVISGIILLKSTLIGPLAELGLISVRAEVQSWAVSLLFVPCAVWLSDWGANRQAWIKALAVGLGIAFLISILWAELFSQELVLPIAVGQEGATMLSENMWFAKEATFFQSETIDMFSSFVIILCIAFVVAALRLSRQRELNALRLQGLLAESNLNLLKSQMHPHFIFNTLNTVSGWMDKDVDKAQELLENLSHLLRSSLRQSKQQEISLREELDFLRKYIDIEQARFSKIMEVKWEICEDCYEAAIPHMILQPLVENTIQHGFQGIKKTGILHISAAIQEKRMIISIRDNGLGIQFPITKGIGLELVKQRLSALYGDQASLVFKQEESGTSATFCLPFRQYSSYSVRGKQE